MSKPWKDRFRRALISLILLFLAGVIWFFSAKQPRSKVPNSVSIQGRLSKDEAVALFRNADSTIRGLYWRRVRFNLTKGYFDRAWSDIRGGPEKIHLLIRDPDGRFSVVATNRLGGSVAIHYPRLPPPVATNKVWTLIGTTVTNRPILKLNRQQ